MNWKTKLSSRKLWTCVVGLLIGIATMFGLNQNEISTIAGAVISVVSVASYTITEGKIDAARISNAAQAVSEAVDVVNDQTNGKEEQKG